MRRISFAIAAAIVLGGGIAASVTAEEKQPGPPMVTLPDGCMSQEGAKNENGKWVLPDGTPTFHICKTQEEVEIPSGPRKGEKVNVDKYKVDWATYQGFRRYHDACHVCHGPVGNGGSFAPALAKSLQTISYPDFLAIVAAGRDRKTPDGRDSVMPAWGDNPNVMCYVDDIYTYLKARAEGAVPGIKIGSRDRDAKPDSAREYEKACFGGK